MTETNYRALCAELLQLEQEQPVEYTDWKRRYNAAIARTRAALAQSEPAAPTDEEIEEWADASSEVPLEEMDPDIHGWRRCFKKKEFGASIRAALARWGTPPVHPVPVSERPWERDGWRDEQGRCWWTANKPGPLPPVWWMVSIPQSCTDGIMLPANVLATPEDTND
jgi:hypothetical protein